MIPRQVEALDLADFPAAARAIARHGPTCLDHRLTDEIDWEILLCALYERGFVIPGPSVGNVSYWLITDHWQRHDLAGLTVLQMLCGGWTHLASRRIFGGALGMPTLLNRGERISETVMGSHVVRFDASRTEKQRPRLLLGFRYASAPAWRSPTRRFRLLKGQPVNPWRPPPDHGPHGKWNIRGSTT